MAADMEADMEAVMEDVRRRGCSPSMTRTTAPWLDPATIRFMLHDTKTWAVVGLSGNRDRTAYQIAAYLQDRGKKIVPIHPTADVVLGEKAYPSLEEVPFEIDVVDVFRRSEFAGQFADEAVKVGAKAVWFQLGVVDHEAFERTTEAGVPMVMDTCPAIEWPRYAG
jgi:predicted CoA-binding protein